MKKTFVAVLLAALMLVVMGVTMSLAAPEAVEAPVFKTVSTSFAFSGDLIIYTMVITHNAGDNFKLVDLTPVNTTYVTHTITPSASDQTGHSLPGTGTGFIRDYVWYQPTSGGVATMTLTVRVNAGVLAGTVITNAAAYYVNSSTSNLSNEVRTTVWNRTYLPIIRR